MGILDALSGGLTAATEAASAQQKGQMEGSQILRAIMAQKIANDEKQAQTYMNTQRGRSFERTADQPPPSEIRQGEDGTFYRISHDGVATPVQMGGAPAQTAPAPQQPTAPQGRPPLPPRAGQGAAPSGAGVLKGKPAAPVPGSPEWEKAEIRKAQIGAQYGYHPDHFTPVTVGGDTPDAPAVVKPFDTRTGQTGPALGNAKQTLKIEGATQTAAKARLEAAVSEMNNAHAGMAEYEDKLKNGTADIGGLQQWAGRAASAFTHDDPASMLAQSIALAALNRTNPELARYIRRGLSFAEGESMISQRPSDFRTKMSAFLSQAASGASPEMIADIQSRRHSILGPLNSTVKPSGSGQPQQGHAPPGNVPAAHVTPAERAALKAQGFTDAQIDAIKP